MSTTGGRYQRREWDSGTGLDRVERLPGASHSVRDDEHDRADQLLIDFLARALPAEHPAR